METGVETGYLSSKINLRKLRRTNDKPKPLSVLGTVRVQSMQRPTLIHMIGPPPSTTTFRPSLATSPTPLPPKSDTALQATTTECPPNATDLELARAANNNNLLRRLQSSHYQSYTTALTVTIAVGCFLLLLNILIFAGIYHQRDRGNFICLAVSIFSIVVTSVQFCEICKISLTHL